MKKIVKNGFTLAEVLITLGIIGVVASLTIPTLMQNADERANVVALKKAYTTLSQAYKLAEQEDGTPDTWGMTTGNSPAGDAPMLNKLKPYLRVDKDCTDGSQGCFPAGVTYVSLKPSLPGPGLYDDNPLAKLKLTDGTLLIAAVSDPSCGINSGSSIALQSVCGRYWVDINGFKKPNQWGKDTFQFYLTKYGIIPMGSAQETAYTFSGTCKDKDTMPGRGCTAWVIYNDNMDYLHCNDLDWTTKTKCN